MKKTIVSVHKPIAVNFGFPIMNIKLSEPVQEMLPSFHKLRSAGLDNIIVRNHGDSAVTTRKEKVVSS